MDGVGLALFEVFALDWTVFWLCGFSSMQPIWVECWCLVGGGSWGLSFRDCSGRYQIGSLECMYCICLYLLLGLHVWPGLGLCHGAQSLGWIEFREDSG